MTERRGPGAATVLGLLLVVLASSVAQPVRLVLIPLALLLVALPPRGAALLALGVVLGAVALLMPRPPFGLVERGWALLAGGWFVLAVVAMPAAPFTTRALAATAAACVTAAAVIAGFGSWEALDWAVANHYRTAAEAAGRLWNMGADGEGMVALAADLPARLFPAMQALATVAALAVAWWMYDRAAGRGQPLGRLTEFRFPDLLVWVLIGALALVVVPSGGWADRLGGNLLLFMGALYALRGLAVLVAVVLSLVGTQVGVLVVLGAVALLLYPIVAAGTLLLGVTDTWLDLRSGRRPVNDGG